jgi:type IV secretion system protein VirD4
VIPYQGWIFGRNGTGVDHLRDETIGIHGAETHPVQAPPDLHADRPLMVLLALGVVLAAAVGTEYVAWRLQFDPRLGEVLFTLSDRAAQLSRLACIVAVGGAVWGLVEPRLRALVAPLVLAACIASLGGFRSIYAPYQLFFWYAASAAVPAAAPLFRPAWLVVGLVAIAWSLALTHLWGRGRRSVVSDSHGSAHWGSGESLWGEEGLLLGRDGRHVLRFPHEGHVLTVAPTRSGKGVSAVIPNLLDHRGSVLVTDPKGENFAVTAKWRKDTGQQVHAFDPFGVAAVVGGGATYNPLDLIDATSRDAVDDARMLADMIVLPRDREGEEAFWNEEARGLLTGLILHAAARPEPAHRTLAHVRENLTLAPHLFSGLLQDEMLASTAAGGLVARAAARLLQKSDNERSGVVSTAQSHTHFLDSPRMATALKESSVDFASLKRGVASVYLILPSDRMDGYARWLRLMIACALLAMARTPGQPAKRVLFLLDEFAHLGRMQPVRRDIGLAGGFGVTFWLVVQDLSQLRGTYGETWATFLANVDVLQAFGVNDWETADYLSKMAGEATIPVESEGRSRGTSHGPRAQHQLNASRNRSESGRRLLLPDEVRRLPRERELLFVKGGAPLRVERLNYLSDREWQARAAPNPLYMRVAVAE